MQLFSIFLFLFAGNSLATEVMTHPPQILKVVDQQGQPIPQWINPSLENHIEVQLVSPAANPRTTVVMVIPGSGAGLPLEKAKEFAQQGYPAVAVRYFDYSPSSPFNFSITRLPLENFKTAADWIRTQTSIAVEKLALHGRSRGGEAALLAGSYYPELFDGLIAEVPSSHVWGDRANGIWTQYAALQPNPEREIAAWTFAGEEIPFVKTPHWLQTTATESSFNGFPSFIYRTAYLDSMKKATAQERRAARIRVEDIQAPLLLTGGGDDLLWPSDQFARRVRRARRARGKADKDVYLIRSRAGHVWDGEFEGPFRFPSGVYDLAKADGTDICAEPDLDAYLNQLRPLPSPRPTALAQQKGYPYEAHKEEIRSLCATGEELTYYLAPEYAPAGGNPAENGRLGKIAEDAILRFLRSL